MVMGKRQSAHRKNSSELQSCEDEILRELYAIRDAYAAEHNYDLDWIYADLKRREGTSRFHRLQKMPVSRTSGRGIKSGRK